MKISHKHLLNFLNEKPSIKEVSEKLFQLGHENEVDDEIIDIDFTPNRGDCLSLNGLARDLNFFYGYRPNKSIYEGKLNSFNFNFKNLSEQDCRKISFLNIEIEEDTLPYKTYLDDYFEDLGINRTNFFTDISNYLLYEIGQPSHCYEFESINEGLTLMRLEKEKSFKTLFDEEIRLSEDDLIFLSGDKVVNLAGVIGGKDSCCNKRTRHIIVEFAHFVPESIIGKNTKYSLNSEAAYRFERGVEASSQDQAVRRFIQIVQDHASIKNISIFSQENPEKNKINYINKDLSKINKILGTNLADNKIENYLEKLHFKIDDVINIPSFRNDISSVNDLAEEVARLIGYDNFGLEKIHLSNISQNPNLESRIRAFLLNAGFNEVINFPFSSSKSDIKILNPIDSNNPFMRSNLSNSLLKNLEFNEKRQKESIKIFEISDVYLKNGFDNTIKQVKKLCLIISGRQGRNFNNFNKKLDKKYLIEMFEDIEVCVKDKIIEHNRSKINTKSKAKIFSLEINLDDLDTKKIANLNPRLKYDFISYKKTSEYPSTTKDLSFLLKDKSKIDELMQVIKAFKHENLVDTLFFDYFEDDNNGFTKLGFRFIFQSTQETLTSDKVSLLINAIYQESIKIQGVSVPGYEKENL